MPSRDRIDAKHNVYRLPFTVDRLPFTVDRLPLTVDHLPFTVYRWTFNVKLSTNYEQAMYEGMDSMPWLPVA